MLPIPENCGIALARGLLSGVPRSPSAASAGSHKTGAPPPQEGRAREGDPEHARERKDQEALGGKAPALGGAPPGSVEGQTLTPEV
jgi:hypothetical protein